MPLNNLFLKEKKRASETKDLFDLTVRMGFFS